MSPTILSLPNELLLTIAESLSPYELIHLYHSSQRFHHLLRGHFIDDLIAEDGPHGALFWSIALKDQDLIRAVLGRCREGIHLDIGQVAIDPPFSVSGGDERLVKFLMDLNITVEVLEEGEQIGPLLWAVRNKSARLARMLISNGFRIDNTPWGYTPRLLARPEPDVAMQNEALIEACKLGLKSLVEVMLEPATVSDIDAVGEDRFRPLQIAAANGHLEVVDVLLKNGAQVDACDHKFEGPSSAIDIAIIGGEVPMWKLMLRYVDVEFFDKKSRSSAIQLAARTGDLALVRYLLEKGAFLATKDVNGRTALHEAAKMGWADVCELLLEWGADTEAVDQLDRTPLLEAAGNGPEAIKILVELGGADVHVKDKSRRTPLHLAARNSGALMEDLNVLIDEGAGLDVKDLRGRSPRGDMQMMTSARARKVRARL